MARPIRLGFIGAGIMGRHHLSVAQRNPEIDIVGVADFSAETRAKLAERGIPVFADHIEMLEKSGAEGVVISTPNAFHVSAAIDCIERGVVPLVEKPVADTLEAGLRLRAALKDTDLPALVGHHRRHNPLIAAAAKHVSEGGLGKVLAVNGLWLRRKPDEYYKETWKMDPALGGGVLLINAIHDFDSLRAICGEIKSVQAMTSSASRGFAVEDTAAILVQFESGALGTLMISDNVVAPWCWEMTSQEDPRFAHVPEDCYLICGTEGSLSVPTLETWTNAPNGGRDAQFTRQRLYHVAAESMDLQMAHFVRVVRREEAPLVSVESALHTLAATLAVSRSAQSGQSVEIAEMLLQA